jgi:hypothetical protein
MEPLVRKRVCVVGAGVAGLVTAKVLAVDGFDVVVFEKEPEIGGVWTVSRTYPGLRANNSRHTYAFSDHPYPDNADDFPTADQIRAYLKSYADRFGIRTLLRLQREVVEVTRQALPTGEAFQVIVRSTKDSMSERHYFHFVAICNGVFSEPNLPKVAQQERFVGRVLHSSQLKEEHLIAAPRVVVVGCRQVGARLRGLGGAQGLCMHARLPSTALDAAPPFRIATSRPSHHDEIRRGVSSPSPTGSRRGPLAHGRQASCSPMVASLEPDASLTAWYAGDSRAGGASSRRVRKHRDRGRVL